MKYKQPAALEGITPIPVTINIGDGCLPGIYDSWLRNKANSAMSHPHYCSELILTTDKLKNAQLIWEYM